MPLNAAAIKRRERKRGAAGYKWENKCERSTIETKGNKINAKRIKKAHAHTLEALPYKMLETCSLNT